MTVSSPAAKRRQQASPQTVTNVVTVPSVDALSLLAVEATDGAAAVAIASAEALLEPRPTYPLEGVIRHTVVTNAYELALLSLVQSELESEGFVVLTAVLRTLGFATSDLNLIFKDASWDTIGDYDGDTKKRPSSKSRQMVTVITRNAAIDAILSFLSLFCSAFQTVEAAFLRTGRNGRRQALHRDFAVTLQHSSSVLAMVAIEKTSIFLCPKSHKEFAVFNFKPEQLHMEAGSILLFSANLVHGGAGGSADGPQHRLHLGLVCHPEESTSHTLWVTEGDALQ